MDKALYLAAAGIVGTLARFGLSCLLCQRAGTDFPYGTLVVNLIGCFLVGLFDTIAQSKYSLAPEFRIILIAGFCGAFTTFSAFILETSNLLKDGEPVKAFLNILLSIVLGFLLFRLGVFLGRFI